MAVDPTYADSHCFLAIIAAVFENDLKAGAASEQQCLADNPSADMRGLIKEYVTPVLQATQDTTGATTATNGTNGNSTPATG